MDWIVKKESSYIDQHKYFAILSKFYNQLMY